MVTASRLARIRAFCEATPGEPFNWYSLAMEERKTDPRAALATFERLLRDHPRYVPTYYQLGKTLEELGDPARAKETYREGIRVALAAGDSHAAGELSAALEA